MKQTNILIAFVASWLLVANANAELALIDKVAVVVDDDIIMESQIAERLTAVVANVQKQGLELPSDDELRHQVVERMIVESLQMQMGERAGVRINDTSLNEAMGNIAKQNNMSLEQFRVALTAEGESYIDMRESVRQEMILKRVQQGNVNNRVQITEQEVDTFLSSEEGRQMTAADYHVGHFMLVVDESMSDSKQADAQQLVNSLTKELRAGRSFEQLLQAQELQGFAVQGGDLGWRKTEDLPSIFAEIVPTLKVGDIAEPIAAGAGIHIIKLIEQRGGETRLIEQTQARHILIKPSEILTSKQAQKKVQALYDQIASGADFAELAKDNSEDIGSAREGGDLGWTSPGQMVPEFEQTMAATDIGLVSQPFESQYGWHILKVDGRRDHDVSDQITKNQASNYIYQRKFEEELEAWLQKIRDEAYVDIK